MPAPRTNKPERTREFGWLSSGCYGHAGEALTCCLVGWPEKHRTHCPDLRSHSRRLPSWAADKKVSCTYNTLRIVGWTMPTKVGPEATMSGALNLAAMVHGRLGSVQNQSVHRPAMRIRNGVYAFATRQVHDLSDYPGT